MSSFTIVQGNTKRLAFTLTDETGAVVNLTGVKKIEWKAAKTVSASTALISKDLDGGVVVTDAEGGKFAVDLAPSDTAALRGDLYYEVRIVDVLDAVSTVASGTMTITQALIH